MEIPLGDTIQRLLKIRKDNHSWDPHGQMPWSDEQTVTDASGKKYKVVTILNPKEVERNANI